ncbi:alanine racemase [bacterium]|nr:alanine racemase [bacterium]
MSDKLTWIEIDAKGLAHNYRLFRSLIGSQVKFCAVVKANAYGHGVVPVCSLLAQSGVDFFAVHSLQEAIELRQIQTGIPILIMGYVMLKDLPEVIRHQFRIVVFNLETIERLGQLSSLEKTPAYLHLKLETGTHRQGIDPTHLPSFLKLIKQYPHLVPEGAYTHFANIEDTTNHQYALMQLTNFRNLVSQIERDDFQLPLKHTACSAAALLFPEAYFNMVRVGISLYGMWPSKETLLSFKTKHHSNDEQVILRPVLTWKTRVCQVKEVKKDSYIGYGCTYKTGYDSRIAILPVGYSDGYDRQLSNKSYVLIKGQRAPVRGRICMNIMMVEVTHIPDVQVEEEVVLIGKQGSEELTADFLAGLVGTINYELLSRLPSHIPRIISPE